MFTSERGGPADLYRIHPDGSGLERLTDDPAYDDQGAFAPDGKTDCFCFDAGRGTREPVDAGCGDAQGDGVDDGRRRGLQAVVVAGWEVDCVFVGSGQRFAGGEGTVGAAATGGYLSDPSGWERAEAHLEAWGFCGSPKWTADSKSVVTYCMSAEETWTYRVGHRGWRDDDREDRYRKRRGDAGGGGAGREG